GSTEICSQPRCTTPLLPPFIIPYYRPQCSRRAEEGRGGEGRGEERRGGERSGEEERGEERRGEHRWKGRVSFMRSEEHTSELQSHLNLVSRLLRAKKRAQH